MSCVVSWNRLSLLSVMTYFRSTTSAERSPSPQTPHPRAADAPSRGIKFPISEPVFDLRPHLWRGSAPMVRCPEPRFSLPNAPHRIQSLWKPCDGRGRNAIWEIPAENSSGST